MSKVQITFDWDSSGDKPQQLVTMLSTIRTLMLENVLYENLVPESGATRLASGLVPTITFSETVVAGEGSIIIRRGSEVVATFLASSDSVEILGNEARILNQVWEPGHQYSIEVPSSAFTGVSGKPFAGIQENEWLLTIDAPVTWTLTPAHQATQVAVEGTHPRIRFSEPVQPRLGTNLSLITQNGATQNLVAISMDNLRMENGNTEAVLDLILEAGTAYSLFTDPQGGWTNAEGQVITIGQGDWTFATAELPLIEALIPDPDGFQDVAYIQTRRPVEPIPNSSVRLTNGVGTPVDLIWNGAENGISLLPEGNRIAISYDFKPGSTYTLRTLDQGIARDSQGNELTLEGGWTFTTARDLEAPSTPEGLAVLEITTANARLSWLEATDNDQIEGYRLRVDGSEVIEVGNALEFVVEGLVAGQTYEIEVASYDPSGNQSNWSSPLDVTLDSVAIPQEAFSVIDLSGPSESTTGDNPDFLLQTPNSISRTWQLAGDLTGTDDIVSNGGVYPDEMMIHRAENTDNPRWPGRNYVRHGTGIGYFSAENGGLFWGRPGVFNPNDPVNTGTLIRPEPMQIYRSHSSYRQVLKAPERDPIYRDLNTPNQGRSANVIFRGGYEDFSHRLTQCNPFLEPVSNNSTKLDDTPVENVAYIAFSIRHVQDSETVSFYWPGQDTGDYSNESTDGAHFAANIRQGKGKQSGTVTWNIKWRGEQVIIVRQLPNGEQLALPTVLVGPGGAIPNPLSTYANQWIDYVIKVRPGLNSLGDQPEFVVWVKPSSQANFVEAYRDNDDLLSEIEDFTRYGIPVHYFGMPDNFGLYWSLRLSGWRTENLWNPFLEAHGTTGYVKCDHTESWVADFAAENDPGEAYMLAQAQALFNI